MAKEIKIIFVSLLHIITFMLAGNNKALAQDDFIVEWTFPSSTSSVRFNALTVGAVNYTWTAMPSGNSGSGSFTRSSVGQVTLSGLNVPAGNKLTVSFAPANLRRFLFSQGGDHNRLTDVKQWGAVPWSSMQQAFRVCSNLTGFSATDTPDLSAVTDMRSMFEGAASFNGDLSTWDVANVTTMSSMFAYATSFNGDLSAWDVANVTTMSSMFYNATSFNQNLGNWHFNPQVNLSHMLSFSGMDCDHDSGMGNIW